MRAFALCLAILALPAAAVAGETQTYSYDELGRLTAVQYSGTVNNGQAHSLCFDPAGNRTKYKSDAAGTLATCTGGGGPPGNQPPVANLDSITLEKCQQGTKNVVANDTDPEGNLPLVLTAVTQSWASVQNSTTVAIVAPDTDGVYTAIYTVRDSLGASANGTLRLTVSGTQLCP